MKDKFKNKTALITGGASGIGKIMGRLALERGADLVIWDINRQALDEVVAEFSTKGKVRGFRVDVSDPADIAAAAAQTGKVDILINNAGIVVGKYFNEHSQQDISRTMRINAEAPMYVAQAFLDDMMSRDSGNICNIASSAGMLSNPKMSVYAASKWAVTGWSDSLRLEMTQLHKNVHVTTVLPYYINTGMFDGVKSSIMPILKPEKVAAKVIRAIEKNRIYLGIPLSYNFMRFVQGILPIRLFDLIIGKMLGVYKTMEHFTGRR